MTANQFIRYKKGVMRIHSFSWDLTQWIECLYKIKLLEEYDPFESITLGESLNLDRLAKEHIKSLDI